MSFFDIAAGLVLLVSVIVGWVRGGIREVAALAAAAVAAAAALFALRVTGPIAQHAIHTVWLANLAAALVVFAGVYILLRVLAGALTRRVHEISGLTSVDRGLGAGFGLARAVLVLGLAGLAIGAAVPAKHLPDWIAGAKLWPITRESGQALSGLAPQGMRLAREATPKVEAVLKADASTPDESSVGNRDYNDPQRRSLEVRVEKTR
jgi:membrane protein required for colicin V production